MYMDTCTETGVTFAPPPQVVREIDEDIDGVIPRTDLERDALAFCNCVRRILGRKPVDRLQKGMCSDEGFCVIANTIGGVQANYFDIYGLSPGVEYTVRTVPPRVSMFMQDFDDHQYPHLIKGFSK